MKHQKTNRANNPGEHLDQALNAMRAQQPDQETMNAAGERVWQRVSQVASFASNAQVESIRGCDDVRSLLPQYRSGQLAPARALLVESHLHECVACRREAETGKRERGALAPWKQELPQIANTGFRWIAAAAAIVIFAIATYFVQDKLFSGPQGMRARVESLNGVLTRVGYGGD
ncbi:MAG TPA: zf-HC2 domain-containing protein, partial [Candidatus Angelobacter sp.]|nr:zf-HC2 domain-containing protein [Candidatus Angelobacter sp.]